MEKRLAMFCLMVLLVQLVGAPLLAAARGGSPPTTGGSSGIISGSSGSSGAAAETGSVFLNVGLYPTRVGTTQVFVTWNASAVAEPIRLYRAVLYFTKSNPHGKIAFNRLWKINDEELFSDSVSCDYREELNIAELQDGACCQREFPYAGYYVIGALVYNRDGIWSGSYFSPYRQTFDSYITTAAPSITYNDTGLTVGRVCEGRRVLEFRRTDTAYGGSSGVTDETTLNEMLFTSLIDMESDNPLLGYYKLGKSPTLYRWRAGRYSVGVNFRSTVNQERISAAIDNALKQINGVMNEFGVFFYRSGTSGSISITVDTELQLFPAARTNRSYCGGTWQIWTSGATITKAKINYACDFRSYSAYNSYEQVVFEELLQTMGAGYDQLLYYDDTVHVDFNYYNKPDYLTARDADILRLVYSDELRTGDGYTTAARRLNIPAGCYMPSTAAGDREMTVAYRDFLDPGATYQVRAFVVNEAGRVSETGPWVTVQTPDYR